MRLSIFQSSRSIRWVAGLLTILCILSGCNTSDDRRNDPVSSETINESTPNPFELIPTFIPDTTPEEQRIQGTISLMLTDASFDCQGDWIYYIGTEGIYKKRLSSLDEEAILVLQLWDGQSTDPDERSSATIQVAGDWIYYTYIQCVDIGTNGKVDVWRSDCCFGRVKTDGSGAGIILRLSNKYGNSTSRLTFNNKADGKIMVYGDWIYYEDFETIQTDASTKKTVYFLARKNLSTGEVERITWNSSKRIFLSFIDPQGTIVYACASGNGSGSSHFSDKWEYYRLNPGKGEELLFNYKTDNRSSYFYGNHPVCSVAPNGTIYLFVDKQRITTAPTNGIYQFTSVSEIGFDENSKPLPGTEVLSRDDYIMMLATDDALYLALTSQEKVGNQGMYHYSSVDGAFTKINNDFMQPLFECDGYLYYESRTLAPKCPQYRCRTDGTEWERLSW